MMILQVGPVDRRGEAAAVDEQRRRAVDGQGAAFLDVLVDFGFGGFGVHALASCGPSMSFCAFAHSITLSLKFSGLISAWCSKTQSWKAQKAHGLLRKTQRLAMAAGLAQGCRDSSGKVLKYSLTFCG